MSKINYSPWFSFSKQPPINGLDSGKYEVKCEDGVYRERWTVGDMKSSCCDKCQWRGILKESK